jgi:hypothetical protein
VLSLYRTRAGQLDLRARRIDESYARAMMFAIQPVVYLSVLTASPFGQAFYNYVPIAPETVRMLATGAVVLSGALTLVVVGFELARSNSSIPKLMYYCIMFSHPTVLYFTSLGMAPYYLIAYFWSHWLIAIGLVSRINTGHYRSLGYRRAPSILRHFLTIGFVCFIVAYATHAFAQFRVFSGRDYKLILTGITPEHGLIIGVVLGIFLSEQLLHYYCDRCLFRMRDAELRKAIGPLL